MKMTVDPKDCTSKVEVFVSERNCLMRTLSILHGLGKMSVPGATDAAVALAKVIGAVETPKRAESPPPAKSCTPIADDSQLAIEADAEKLEAASKASANQLAASA